MEIGGVSRTSSAAGAQFAARQDMPSQAGAVRTNLASTQSVQQATAIVERPVSFDMREDARSPASRVAAMQSFIERSNDYDVKARELVTRSINSRTGEIVRQFPDDLTLKLRAFARDINEKRRADEVHHSDVGHVTRVA